MYCQDKFRTQIVSVLKYECLIIIGTLLGSPIIAKIAILELSIYTCSKYSYIWQLSCDLLDQNLIMKQKNKTTKRYKESLQCMLKDFSIGQVMHIIIAIFLWQVFCTWLLHLKLLFSFRILHSGLPVCVNRAIVKSDIKNINLEYIWLWHSTLNIF